MTMMMNNDINTKDFEDLLIPSSSTSNPESHSTLLHDLSVLGEKVQELQSLIALAIAPSPNSTQTDPAAVRAAAATLIQETIFTASSTLHAFQQLSCESPALAIEKTQVHDTTRPDGRVLIELDAADLLAKYTHFCKICGKGFMRDANVRMHMRSHGDEYRTSAALMARDENGAHKGSSKHRCYYSCPQEGCRWNRRHPGFRPLKSMVCVKNHYRRSHCPKMYVCKRCGRKQFSMLSDLRTHEKHCRAGGLAATWRCSCGTTFSRKDKLMGHVSLFAAGHAPETSTTTAGN